MVVKVTKYGGVQCVCSYNTISPTQDLKQYTLVQALRLCTGRTAHKGSKGIALPFHDHGTRRGEGSVSRPAALYPR